MDLLKNKVIPGGLIICGMITILIMNDNTWIITRDSFGYWVGFFMALGYLFHNILVYLDGISVWRFNKWADGIGLEMVR